MFAFPKKLLRILKLIVVFFLNFDQSFFSVNIEQCIIGGRDIKIAFVWFSFLNRFFYVSVAQKVSKELNWETNEKRKTFPSILFSPIYAEVLNCTTETFKVLCVHTIWVISLPIWATSDLTAAFSCISQSIENLSMLFRCFHQS